MGTKPKRRVTDVTVQRLNDLESARGLTQREVASGISMPEQTYSNKKNNTGRSFNKKDLVALADFFDVSTDYLLGRIPTPWPDPYENEVKS